MAGVKISALPPVPVAPQLADIFAEVQPAAGGTTYKVSFQQLLTLYNANIQIAESQVTNLVADLAGKLNLSGGTMTGTLDMGSHFITDLLDPVNPQDAATKAYVDGTSGAFLPLAGGTMLGVINMGNHKITNLTDPTNAQDAATKIYVDTGLNNYLPLAGGTMGGVINMNSNKITNVTDPTNAQDAATKAYVDSVATGLNIQGACYAGSTANLTATYANGAGGIGATLTNSGAMAAFSIDGVSPPLNSRILIKDQSSTLENGIYTLTTVGSGASNWVLTRATDYDQPSEISPGDLVIVNNGTVNATTSWLETASVSAVGTDPILFSQFTFAPTAYLLKANNLSDVASTTAAFDNISPLTTKGDILAYSTTNTRLAVGATNGQILGVNSGAATGLAWSTPAYPMVSGTSGKIIISDGTNNVYSTPTYPNAASTSGKVIISDGTNFITSTPTFPNASATAGKVIVSDGTNWIASTPTFPNASATTGKIIISDGTNWIASTPTFPAAAGASGNVLTSNGTNWVSSAPATGSVTSVATAGLATGGPITTTGTVTVTAAVKSDQTTATSTSVAVVPGVQQYHPSAAKVWIKYTTSGSTSITTSYNVSSLTDNGTGDTTINFTVAFANANYSYSVGCNNSLGFAASIEQNTSGAAPATGSCRFVSFRISTDAAVDMAGQCVQIHGDQ